MTLTAPAMESMAIIRTSRTVCAQLDQGLFGSAIDAPDVPLLLHMIPLSDLMVLPH